MMMEQAQEPVLIQDALSFLTPHQFFFNRRTKKKDLKRCFKIRRNIILHLDINS